MYRIGISNWNCRETLAFLLTCDQVRNACACHAKRHLNLQKWSEPTTVFHTFHLDMCFAPQRRTLFRHRSFQKCSEREVFLAFLNVLLATTACNFSSLIWPHGSAPAALASLLFDPRSPKSLEKRNESRLPYLFAHLPLLSRLSFSSLIFSLLLFSSLTLPTSAFPSVHIVGSLTSKLPSTWAHIWLYTFVCVSQIFLTVSCNVWHLSYPTPVPRSDELMTGMKVSHPLHESKVMSTKLEKKCVCLREHYVKEHMEIGSKTLPFTDDVESQISDRLHYWRIPFMKTWMLFCSVFGGQWDLGGLKNEESNSRKRDTFCWFLVRNSPEVAVTWDLSIQRLK